MVDPETVIKGDALAVESIETWREQLARILLRALSIVGALVLAAAIYMTYIEQRFWLIPIYLGVYGVLLLVTFWRRVSYKVQATVAIILLCGVGVLNMTQFGLNAESSFFLLTVPFMTVLFYGKRGGYVSIVVICVIVAIIAALFVTDQIVVDASSQLEIADVVGSWVTMALVFLMLSLALVFAQNYLLDHFGAALTRERGLMQELEVERGRLEKVVEERTRDLTRRTHYLEITTMIAHDAASELDLQGLLLHVVRLVSERFGFYHTAVFLIDPTLGNLELRAASSEGGRRMLAGGYRLPIGAESIVGYVAARGVHRVAFDVGEGAVRFDNPDLPSTRSEAALPLRARGSIIGVLDVQSREPEAFDQEDLVALQTLADQVAVAISNAQLFWQVEEKAAMERQAYAELSRQAWQRFLRSEVGLGFFSDALGTTPISDKWLPEMRTALRTGEVVPGNDGSRLAVPIKVRDQVIGVIDGSKPEGSGGWSPEEIDLFQTLTERLGVALESARLYRDSQRREIRERTVGQISAHVRETLDLETVLKVAVQEVRQVLELPEVVIRLAPGRHEKE